MRRNPFTVEFKPTCFVSLCMLPNRLNNHRQTADSVNEGLYIIVLHNEPLAGCLSAHVRRQMWLDKQKPEVVKPACVITCRIPHLDTPQLETNILAFNIHLLDIHTPAYTNTCTNVQMSHTLKMHTQKTLHTCTANNCIDCTYLQRCIQMYKHN